MKTITLAVATMILLPVLRAQEANPKIDYRAFSELTARLEAEREKRRVSEEEFLRLAAEPGTVVLDTRSRTMYDRLHVKGALHLNFSDFNEESLHKLIPDKNTRVLIYCNNNFANAGPAMITKCAPLALNVPTFINLWGYGYQNIHELAPLLDRTRTRIPFEGTDAGTVPATRE